MTVKHVGSLSVVLEALWDGWRSIKPLNQSRERIESMLLKSNKTYQIYGVREGYIVAVGKNKSSNTKVPNQIDSSFGKRYSKKIQITRVSIKSVSRQMKKACMLK